MRAVLNVVKENGPPHRITIEADSPQAASDAAQAQGYLVISVKSTSTWRSIKLFPPLQPTRLENRWSHATTVIFIEQFIALLKAGLSVIEALNTLHPGAPSVEIRRGIETLTRAIQEGRPLSAALKHTGHFSESLVALVRSSEVTSDLPNALERYLEHEKQSSRIKHQIKSIALYPALLVAVGGAVMAFLLLYVMPRFARIFESLNNLPWSAELIVAWAGLLEQHRLVLFLVLFSACLCFTALILAPRTRSIIVQSSMAWSPLARYFRVYFLARWYATTGMLVQGGLPLPEAVALANEVLPGSMQHTGQRVEQGMRQGLSPSVAYQLNQLATPVALQLIQAGERTGDVGLMLKRAAEFHASEVTRAMENCMRLIEPLTMTLIGLGVGVIVILMYLPIFELAAAIQ